METLFKDFRLIPIGTIYYLPDSLDDLSLKEPIFAFTSATVALPPGVVARERSFS